MSGHDATANGYASIAHEPHEMVAANCVIRKENPEGLIIGFSVRRVIGREKAGDSGQQVLIASGEGAAPGHHLTELTELDQTDGCLDICHPEVEADLGVTLPDRLLAAVPFGRADI